MCEGFVFRSGCGELKIDFVIPWVRVTLEALQSPLAPLSPLSGSAAAAVEVGGGWAAGFCEYPVSCSAQTPHQEVNSRILVCPQPPVSEFRGAHCESAAWGSDGIT